MPRDKERQKENQRRHRDRNFERLVSYLVDKGCVDCDISEPVVLQFDHLPEFEKKFDIGRAITGSTRGWDAILKEIAKCELVCANCHAKRTAQRSGWRKHQLSEGTYERNEGLFEKATNHRVEHGGGVRGQRGCKCGLCRAKNAEYSRKFYVPATKGSV
jgi:hypothetical protein